MNGDAAELFDIEDVRRTARAVGRRASAFLQIGLQPAFRGEFPKLELNYGSLIRIWPEECSEEEKKSLLEDYRHWIIGNVLKECDHAISILFSRLGEMLVLAEKSVQKGNRKIDGGSWGGSVYEDYKRIITKKNHIEKDVDLLALGKLRNILTHSMGYVNEKNLTDKSNGTLKLTWFAPHVFAVVDKKYYEARGSSTKNLSIPENSSIVDGVGIKIKIVEKIFYKSDRVFLSEQDVSEIIFTYHLISKRTTEIALNRIKAIFQSAEK